MVENQLEFYVNCIIYQNTGPLKVGIELYLRHLGICVGSIQWRFRKGAVTDTARGLRLIAGAHLAVSNGTHSDNGRDSDKSNGNSGTSSNSRSSADRGSGGDGRNSRIGWGRGRSTSGRCSSGTVSGPAIIASAIWSDKSRRSIRRYIRGNVRRSWWIRRGNSRGRVNGHAHRV